MLKVEIVKPVNPFTAVIEANAFFPWAHEVSRFCSCSQCHAVRIADIDNKCAVIWEGVNALEWLEGVPSGVASACALDPTVVRRSPCSSSST